jgi:DnaJ family protein C protein 1
MQTVVMFLVLLTSGLHYLVQRITYKTDLARVERFIHDARAAAWGPRMVPVDGRRKVRVSLGGPPRYDEDGNPITGRGVEMVVDGNGDVFIVCGC